MKIKISVFFLIFLLVFGLSGITIHGNSKILLNDNDKTIYLKSGEYLFNDIEQKVVEHSEIVEFEYYINGISSINNMILSYEASNDNVSIDLEQTSNSEFLVSLMSNATGENSIEVSCVLYLTNGEQIILKDEIFIYSREDYDFISKASMLDAKFYCYTYITNTDNPTFEEYDEFYSTNQNENIISTNISSNLSIEDKATVMSMDNINVSGKITWVDEDGRSHNASNVTVEIIDEDILGINNVLDTVTTNDLGQYNASVSNSSFLENGGNDIKLRVSTQGGNIEVVNNVGAVYKVTQKEPRMNITDTYLYLDFEIDPNEYTKDEDKERTYAFRVHQAMNLGAEYVETKKGDKLDTIRVKFPTTKSTSCYNGSKIFILEEDKNDWDVMLHEYGHYVSDYYNIDNNPGEDHDIGDCLNTRYGKNDGMNLAWGEGWPTYFSISAQLEMNASSLNIANVGDESYSDTDDLNFTYSLETPFSWFYQYGESNEVAIAAVLLDLADGKNDDNINLGYTYIWQLICNNQCKDFSSFINTLYSLLSNDDCLEVGKILSSYEISPKLTNPSNNSTSDWDIPTFSWSAQGGENNGSVSYENNLFTILFYDKYKNIIYESSQMTGTSYTPSELEWIEITSNSNEYLYWCVKGYQTTSFVTGGYYSDYRKLYLSTPENITLDSNVYDSIDEDDVKWYKFVAPMKGTYVFETISEYDTFGELFSTIAYNNSTTNRLIYNDDGEGYNFKIEYDLEYNQVVYVRVRGWNWSPIDEYTLTVSTMGHLHDYSYSYETSTTLKHKAYCSCGEYINEQHNYVNNVCTECGQTYSHTHSYTYQSHGNGRTHSKICSCGISTTESCIGLAEVGAATRCVKCNQVMSSGSIIMGNNDNDENISPNMIVPYLKEDSIIPYLDENEVLVE